ncbi:MAG: HD domain-containing protein [Chloroflexota bacterium]
MALGLVPLAWLMAIAYELVGPLVAIVFALPLYRPGPPTSRSSSCGTCSPRPSVRWHPPSTPATHRPSGTQNTSPGSRSRSAGRWASARADLELLEWGGLFHDIGKIGISDAVLLKPGRLDREERIEMNRHLQGAEITPRTRTGCVPSCRSSASIMSGTTGRATPTASSRRRSRCSLGSSHPVADAFEAMTAVRPYQPRPKGLEQALDELQVRRDPVRPGRRQGLRPDSHGTGASGEIAADPTRDLPGP